MTTPSYSGTSPYTGIAFDFSPYFERMATAAETVATNSTTIATNSTTIATKLTSMEADIKILSDLGKGTGIHTVGPYEWINQMGLYRFFIEQGAVLNVEDNVDDANTAVALANFQTYLTKIKSLPTMY